MLIDRESLPRHKPWIVFVVVVTIIASSWFLVDALQIQGRPSGSSASGLTFGVLGALIIVFEFLLWPRKMGRVRTWRIGRTELWLRAHIWLGLLSLPLALLHSGFRMGGYLSSVLLIVFLLVIVSGLVGLLIQQYLPSRMLHEVPAETIYSQISQVVAQLRTDADRLVAAACGAMVEGDESAMPSRSAVRPTDEAVVVGALGRIGDVQGRILQAIIPGDPVRGCELLQQIYHETIRPFLVYPMADISAPLQTAASASGLFRSLRTSLGAAAHPTVLALESLCEQRRQLERQSRIHFWLHSWLWIHLPLSAALLFLLFVHVWVAIRYW